jgi:broad specificity phosphatase PhoE
MREPLVADDASAQPDAAQIMENRLGLKTVLVVRHAESTQNVAMRRLMHCDCCALPAILTLGQDPYLSEAGVAQLGAAAPGASALIAAYKVELVAHSPLRRAKETAERLFGGGSAPLVEVVGAHEATVPETLCCCRGVDRRIDRVQRWLLERPERTIVLVGHKHFFKRALKRRADITNVGVVECRCDTETGALHPLRDLAALSEFRPPEAGTNEGVDAGGGAGEPESETMDRT